MANAHSTTLYAEPVSLAIRGTYNDYGRIENIDRTPYVEYLERSIGATIETIVRWVTAFQGADSIIPEEAQEKNHSFISSLDNYVAMFEHESVIDDLIKHERDQVSEWGLPEPFNTIRWYNELKRIYHDAKNMQYSPTKVFRRAAHAFPLEDGTGLYEFTTSYLYQVQTLGMYVRVPHVHLRIQEFDTMHRLFPELLCDDLIMDYAELLALDNVMRSLNKMFLPAMSGSQHGDQYAEKALIRSMTNLNDKYFTDGYA